MEERRAVAGKQRDAPVNFYRYGLHSVQAVVRFV